MICSIWIWTQLLPVIYAQSLRIHQPASPCLGFYHPQYRGSGALWIPNSVKAHIWSSFWQDPEGWISRCVTTECWGDQGSYGRLWAMIHQHFRICIGMVCKLQGRCCGTGSKYASARYSGNGALPKDCRIIFSTANRDLAKCQRIGFPLSARFLSKN